MTGAHAVVIPLYGCVPEDLAVRLEDYGRCGLGVVLVQNNPDPAATLPAALQGLLAAAPDLHCLANHNRGGVAGGFNRGAEWAIARGARWITLLDQDSQLSAADLLRLQEPWAQLPGQRLLVGPCIWDGRRDQRHGRDLQRRRGGFVETRLLISSGTTFRAVDWPLLGPMQEWLVVDFVDHAWSFQAQERGFVLLQHPQVVLTQAFGQRHPHRLCRWLGMELYSPSRHFYALRNLRWLLQQPQVPLDLKLKEVVKMLVKPWLWLLCEPRRAANLTAIVSALRSPLPPPAGRSRHGL